MEPIMSRRLLLSALGTGLAALLSACGGGGSAASNGMQTGQLQMLIGDASSEDWSEIGVRVLGIALIPQDGGADITVWTAPSPAPMVNLEELDQLGELLGQAAIPAGAYSGAVLTIAGNPGDVALVVAPNPESGFAGTPGATIPASQIQIQGTQGASGNLTVPVTVSFATPLVISASGSNVLYLDFDLGHPAFIVAHNPPAAAGATIWAVNFRGPVRRHRVGDLRWLVLRHSYGTVQTVGTTSFTMLKDFPVEPASNPEGEITSSVELTINADAVNGTIVYDADNGDARTVVKDFSGESSLAGKYVRVAARYQSDGSLVAVRVWASTTFARVWLSPEGHVLSVDDTNGVMTVETEAGTGMPVTIGPDTLFYFRAPQDAQADAAPIGQGPGFLASGSLVRGFKVHVSPVDALANPLVADSVDIETAAYSGTISNASTTGFTYTRHFVRAADDYTVNLGYIPATAANTDPSGDAIMGFDWWNFAFPTLADTGAGAVADFVSASSGSVSFGGTVGAVRAWGASYALWSATAPVGWQVPMAVLEPAPLPLGAVVTGLSAGGSFTLSVAGGATPAAVDVDTTAGSATLVYQVDRSNGVVSVSPIDVSTPQGLTTLTNSLTAGTPLKVWGIPQPAPTSALKAYVIFYFTGIAPAS
ncbi:MAG TPA: DUF4382 domain-containing protein [Steroidobacteraceae bacterium]|nr:DUF4382 domain-containing protein [Steroidobacteraceae bacterium]